MKNLSRYFKGIEPGTICTGTVHYFGLDAKKLQKLGVIKRQEVQRQGCQKTNEYIFVGLNENFITEEMTSEAIDDATKQLCE